MRKNYTKQLFVVIVTLLCSVAASAYDFEVDGIYYNILSEEEEKTVEVVAYSDWSNYSGNIEIPETVHQTWLGPEYTVVAIGNNAFQYCQLDNITLPKTIKVIGNNAFENCSGLSFLKIPQEIEHIGNDAFNDSDFSGSLTIPISCKYIGKWAFGHTDIENLYFEQGFSLDINNLCIIGDYAFGLCNSLTSVNLQALYYHIGMNPFTSCENLKKIEGWDGHVKDTIYTIDDGCIYRYNSNTKEQELLCCPAGKDNYTFPSKITSIGNMAFRGCKKITFLNIPNTVKKIGDYALSMTESNTYTYYKVIVPKSVEEIGTDAFGYFGHNWDIYIYNANIKIGFIVNWGNHEYGNIHIPFGTKESFIKNNPRTNDFFNIIDDIDRQYTISYIVDGKLYRTDNIIYGSKITLIDEPQKEGYTFSGWSEAPETMPAENITISGTFAAIPGDVDMSNIVSIGDVVAVVCHILEKPTAVFNFMAADVTGDNNVSVSDIVGIVNIILNPETEYSVGRNSKRGAVAYSSDRLTMADARSEAGSVAIPVSLNNSTAYTAFQMDVELPEGATLASATLADRAASSHSISWQTMADNKVRVVAYSLGNATFAGNDGELLTLNVEAAEGASGTVTVDNVRMATADGIENTINGCGSTIDINGTTGIGSIDGNIFKVYMADGSLVVESGKAMQLPVYSLNGRLLKVLDIAAGKNTFEALPAGVYVVNGVKVKL